jgi:secreted Zn-dependent insulinase-like peptidase
MAMEVLASMLQQPFYAELRTNQQLGYIVAAGVRAQNDVRSLTLTGTCIDVC